MKIRTKTAAAGMAVTSNRCGPAHTKERTTRSKIVPAIAALLTGIAMMSASETAATAATADGTALEACAGPTAPRALLAAGSPNAVRPGASHVLAIAQYKAQHDTQAAQVRRAAAASATHNARKAAMIRSGKTVWRGPVPGLSSAAAAKRCARSSRTGPGAMMQSVTTGAGYAWVNYLNQQGQQTWYWCGPATVSEIAITVPGPSWVDQGTAASYMGTNSNTGTSISAMVSALNYYVGQVDYGWNFYGFVGMDYSPTDVQRSAFLSDLQYDVSVNSPIAGDAWEVAWGPHLIGHPQDQTIFHYFEIGGWDTNTSQVYYADSATTSWNTVPPYSWEDTYTVETILGGRGYIW